MTRSSALLRGPAAPAASQRSAGQPDPARATSRALSEGTPAVLVGLDCPTGLQSARRLARSGVSVIGLAADRRHFCCRTRACRHVIESRLSGRELIDALLELSVSLKGPAVLLPCTDLSVQTLSRNRERLAEHYRFALPPPDALENLLDKVAFVELAQRHDWPIPESFILRSVADAEAVVPKVAWPCIVKPPVKTQQWEAFTRHKGIVLRSGGQLVDAYRRYAAGSDVLLVQRWIDGGPENLFQCHGYWDKDGRPRVLFTTQKVRQWPPETGVGTLGVEVENPEVVSLTRRVFGDVPFHGLGYLEVKWDPSTGRYLVVEPNLGRPTGRTETLAAAGIDILNLFYCEQAGLSLPNVERANEAGPARWIYWRRDLQAAAWHWWRKELTLRDWWHSIRGPKVEAVWSFRDPAPGVWDWCGQLRRIVRRRR